MQTKTKATIEDLYRVPEDGKTELVDEEIVITAPTGALPSRGGNKTWLSLYDYERKTGEGIAVGDNAGIHVKLPKRGSFSPDAAFYLGKQTI